MLPTFSQSGWVTNPLERVDFMIAHFFETQKSQTHFHKNSVSSYQSLIADAPSPGQLATNVETYLGEYLSTQFQRVAIEVEVKGAFGDPNNNELTIEIGCSLDADGVRYTLSHAIELLGTNVKKIRRLDETGSTNEPT